MASLTVGGGGAGSGGGGTSAGASGSAAACGAAASAGAVAVAVSGAGSVVCAQAEPAQARAAPAASACLKFNMGYPPKPKKSARRGVSPRRTPVSVQIGLSAAGRGTSLSRAVAPKAARLVLRCNVQGCQKCS